MSLAPLFVNAHASFFVQLALVDSAALLPSTFDMQQGINRVVVGEKGVASFHCSILYNDLFCEAS